MTAREVLDAALLELAFEGMYPVCASDPERWFEGGPLRLAAVERLCVGCPVLGLCAAAGDEGRERWGVWGGRDRTAEHVRVRAREAS